MKLIEGLRNAETITPLHIFIIYNFYKNCQWLAGNLTILVGNAF
uniref:Uncharacterized protein n=1 Tax=uncultured bacterium contig00023 TaxID=1181512 RepID=A0A806JZF9_9BACT|nr:hypothetical protein [uncultured bacterium contig00023]